MCWGGRGEGGREVRGGREGEDGEREREGWEKGREGGRELTPSDWDILYGLEIKTRMRCVGEGGREGER